MMKKIVRAIFVVLIYFAISVLVALEINYAEGRKFGYVITDLSTNGTILVIFSAITIVMAIVIYGIIPLIKLIRWNINNRRG